MNRVGIVANPNKPIIQDLIPWLVRWIEEKGLTVSLNAELARYIDGDRLRQMCRIVDAETEVVVDVDWVIAIGGDGTLLKTARFIGPSNLPILGVNTGTLGFMMQTTPDELVVALDHITRGAYFLDERIVLLSDVRHYKDEGASSPTHSALNDVVIDKGAVCRVIELSITVNDEYVNTVIADGLIVATPTGSTAYSLAAGGPIVTPALEALIIAPICPHTLSNRAMVLSSHDRVSIEVQADRPDMMLTIDGQDSLPLQSGDCIDIRRASYSMNLINYRTRSFYEVLRTKLKWGER